MKQVDALADKVAAVAAKLRTSDPTLPANEAVHSAVQIVELSLRIDDGQQMSVAGWKWQDELARMKDEQALLDKQLQEAADKNAISLFCKGWSLFDVGRILVMAEDRGRLAPFLDKLRREAPSWRLAMSAADQVRYASAVGTDLLALAKIGDVTAEDGNLEAG